MTIINSLTFSDFFTIIMICFFIYGIFRSFIFGHKEKFKKLFLLQTIKEFLKDKEEINFKIFDPYIISCEKDREVGLGKFNILDKEIKRVDPFFTTLEYVISHWSISYFLKYKDFILGNYFSERSNDIENNISTRDTGIIIKGFSDKFNDFSDFYIDFVENKSMKGSDSLIGKIIVFIILFIFLIIGGYILISVGGIIGLLLLFGFIGIIILIIKNGKNFSKRHSLYLSNIEILNTSLFLLNIKEYIKNIYIDKGIILIRLNHQFTEEENSKEDIIFLGKIIKDLDEL